MDLPAINEKSTLLQRALAIALVAVPLATATATAYIGGRFASASSDRQTNAKFVELAVSILREKPNPQSVDIRSWAMDVLDRYSGVQLSAAARRSLADSVRLLTSNDMWVELKVNGTHGTVVLPAGASYLYTWTSANATACQLTSPVASGINVTGSSTSISPSHPWYPHAGSPVTIAIVCTNGIVNARDSAVVTSEK